MLAEYLDGRARGVNSQRTDAPWQQGQRAWAMRPRPAQGGPVPDAIGTPVPRTPLLPDPKMPDNYQMPVAPRQIPQATLQSLVANRLLARPQIASMLPGDMREFQTMRGQGGYDPASRTGYSYGGGDAWQNDADVIADRAVSSIATPGLAQSVGGVWQRQGAPAVRPGAPSLVDVIADRRMMNRPTLPTGAVLGPRDTRVAQFQASGAAQPAPTPSVKVNSRRPY